MVEVVFPPKEFMIEKYGLVTSYKLRVTSKKNQEQRAKIKDGKKEEVYSEQFAVNSKEKRTANSKLQTEN